MKKKSTLPKNILFEIGTEELPATNLADLFESKLEDNPLLLKWKKVFEDKRIAVQSAKVFATARRLVFFAEGVGERQAAQETFIKLLSKEEGQDASGQATEKLTTILKHRQVALGDTVVQPYQGKDYIFIKKIEPALPTEKILPEICRTLLKSLSFPKNMKWDVRWEDGADFVFPRPVRNFLCLYASKPIAFQIGSLKAGRETVIFSKSQRKRYRVLNTEAYEKLLVKEGVLLDPSKRKETILALLESKAHVAHGKLHPDPFLLNEINFLVENPSVILAPFDEAFLKLPKEVLTVSMARKQRIFGLLDAEHRVLPKFLGVLDGAATEAEKKAISKNYEHILHAKLQDSLFFYQEDSKLRLDKKREELKGLIFLKNAGSMLEKTERLVRLSKKMSAAVNGSEQDQQTLERACFLSKADLLTQMVGEFPELQGIMGKYYALENGEDSKVAEAIGEQYFPRTAQDRLPSSWAGSLLSLLDKMDLLTACFGLGLEPTSSLDPYGLRRSATAIIKISLDKNLDFSLTSLIRESADCLGAYAKEDKKKDLLSKLSAFFKDRLKAVLMDRGLREDLVEAVMATKFESLTEVSSRAEALSRLVSQKDFMESWKVVERTVNILKGNKEVLPDEVTPSLFVEELERKVYQSYQEHQASIRQATESRNFQLATSLYAKAFFDIVGEFFEKVFVNADDLSVRKNRLGLLRAVKDLYTRDIADLSKLRLN